MGNPKGVKRDFDQLERRRLQAAKLFDKGLSQAEVSRQLNVHRQSVSRWHQAWKANGARALRKVGRAGRKPLLQAAQLEQLSRGLKRGPEAMGYGTGPWTTRQVAEFIHRQIGLKFHPGHVWRILRSLGWSSHRLVGRGTWRDEV
ncbi:MAG TPA: helix-turn-helix domain-containing protein, partial [Verrucomicrobiae bacterium]|nr:helix-turn-helix domain-containing protein [Verrucomicrobiae bacterium]